MNMRALSVGILSALLAVVVSHAEILQPFSDCKITIERHRAMPGVSSASGIEIANSTIYVGRDDAPFLYQVFENFRVSKEIPLPLLGGYTPGTPRAEVKVDVESLLVLPDKTLVAFGSGSYRPISDVAYMLFPTPSRRPRMVSLEKLYDAMRASVPMKGQWLNIEGATISGEFLLLFQRANYGGNLVFVFPRGEFVDYLYGHRKELPTYEIAPVKLPFLQEFQAAFSGAATIPGDEQLVLFSASVEATKDPDKDGPILGSYIGILEFDEHTFKLLAGSFVERHGDVEPVKIEGLTVVERQPSGRMLAYGVTDKDNGTSDVLDIRIQPQYVNRDQ